MRGKTMHQLGMFQVGAHFKAAPDSKTPDMEFTIIQKGIKDADGFDAVELQFSDGEKGIQAYEGLEAAIDSGCQYLGINMEALNV